MALLESGLIKAKRSLLRCVKASEILAFPEGLSECQYLHEHICEGACVNPQQSRLVSEALSNPALQNPSLCRGHKLSIVGGTVPCSIRKISLDLSSYTKIIREKAEIGGRISRNFSFHLFSFS